MLERYLRENYCGGDYAFQDHDSSFDICSILSSSSDVNANDALHSRQSGGYRPPCSAQQRNFCKKICFDSSVSSFVDSCYNLYEPKSDKKNIENLENFKRLLAGKQIRQQPASSKKRVNKNQSKMDFDICKNNKSPFTKLKKYCKSTGKVDEYRRKMQVPECGPIVPPRKHFSDGQKCCMPINATSIKSLIKGVDFSTKKKSVDVCYDPKSNTAYDVFLVRLGSRTPSEPKQHAIEIELKRPRMKFPSPIQICTKESQIREDELDKALGNPCKKHKKRRSKKIVKRKDSPVNCSKSCCI